MEEPSLQSKLKIARRDDVIGFPQLSTPLTHTHTHLLSQTQVWACICTYAYNTHSFLQRGGMLLGPRAAGAGKPGECVCMYVCVYLCAWICMNISHVSIRLCACV